MRPSFAAAVFIIFTILVPSVSAREWTSVDAKKKIDARFVSMVDGVLTLDRSGEILKTKPDQFSVEDQKWIDVAVEVRKKSRLNQMFKVVMVAKNGDCICRMAIDPKQRTGQKDIYVGDFFVIPSDDPIVSDIGTYEEIAKDLFWSGTARVEVDSSELTGMTRELWNDWLAYSRARTSVLLAYRTDFESSVDRRILPTE
jgi:hypothetical protein